MPFTVNAYFSLWLHKDSGQKVAGGNVEIANIQSQRRRALRNKKNNTENPLAFPNHQELTDLHSWPFKYEINKDDVVHFVRVSNPTFSIQMHLTLSL